MKKIKVITTTAGVMPAPGEFKSVAYDLVRPDPNQPRKTFDQAKLSELADSIRTQGIVSPLVVRLVPAKYVIREPELHEKRWLKISTSNPDDFVGFDSKEAALRSAGPDLHPFYQIIFGERRWRAAGICELKELPVIVRELTEKDKFILQFIENHQRENLSALEEAAALKLQIEQRREANPEFSPEDLAGELGMSRASMYERLKLTRLHEPVREALLAGKISTSVAGEVAKLPNPKSQEKLLKQITNESAWEYPFSVRDVQKVIDADYVKQLGSADFDVKKVDYFPAGVAANSEINPGPCAECPLRTGNMLDQFPELKVRPNVCTNTVCFKAKSDASWKIKQKECELEGITTITEKEYENNTDKYVTADKTCYDTSSADGYKSWGTLMGKKKPKPVLVNTDEGIKELFPKEEALFAAKQNGVKFGSYAGGGRSAADKAKEKRNKLMKRAAQQASQTIAAKLSSVFPTSGGENSKLWPIIAKAAYDLSNIEMHDFVAKARGLSETIHESRTALEKFLKGTTDTVALAKFTFEILLCARWDGGGWHDSKFSPEFQELARMSGVKLDKLMEDLKDAKPSKAKKVEDSKQPDLLKVTGRKKMSASDKARMIAAQKARWAKIKAAKT